MPEFLFGAAMGAIVASACWWIYVRSLSGVKSDLADVAKDVSNLTKPKV